MLTSLAAAKSFAKAPLSYSSGLTGMGFYDQDNRLIVTVSNPGTASVSGSVTLRTLGAGLYTATDLVTNASSSFLVLTGQATLSVTVARWDTRVFAITES